MESSDFAKLDNKMKVDKVNGVDATFESHEKFLEDQLDQFLSQIKSGEFTKNSVESDNILVQHYDNEFHMDLYNIIDDHEIKITEDDILNLLKIEYRWPYKYMQDIETPRPGPASVYGFDNPVQVITHNSAVEMNAFYSRDGKFLFDEWKKYYDLGFTTMLSDVMDLTEDLRSLRDTIFKYTGRNLMANFYLTNGNENNLCQPSWNPHEHAYPVAVKVIYGDTKWIIGTEEQQFFAGDTILIPPKTTHAVVECPNKRLSLTINLQ